MLLVEKLGLEVGAVPINTTGAAALSGYMSLRDFSHICFLIAQGAWAGGTPAVTLLQATSYSGTGSKALALPAYWSKAGITASQWARTAVVSDTFNLTATANIVTAVEVNAADLDVANGFDHVAINVASPGANADLIAIFAVLSGARNPQALALDAKT